MDRESYSADGQKNLFVQQTDDYLLIYDAKARKIFCLDKISASVRQLREENKSAFEICRELSARFGSPVTEDKVGSIIEQLEKQNLV